MRFGVARPRARKPWATSTFARSCQLRTVGLRPKSRPTALRPLIGRSAPTGGLPIAEIYQPRTHCDHRRAGRGRCRSIAPVVRKHSDKLFARQIVRLDRAINHAGQTVIERLRSDCQSPLTAAVQFDRLLNIPPLCLTARPSAGLCRLSVVRFWRSVPSAMRASTHPRETADNPTSREDASMRYPTNLDCGYAKQKQRLATPLRSGAERHWNGPTAAAESSYRSCVIIDLRLCPPDVLQVQEAPPMVESSTSGGVL